MAITGVIRPPPEIRAVADRTASYVAKNGRTFEARILKSAKGKTPKFAFLHPTSPFHAYYEDRITFYENGGDDSEEKEAEVKNDDPQQIPLPKIQESMVRKTERTQVASAIDPIAKALIAQRAKILQARGKQEELEPKGEIGEGASSNTAPTSTVAPPSPLEFVNILPPANVTSAQLEIIQLVAQFAALDGKGGTFLYQLSTREWNNREFSFCQPRHPHFAYFSALVDAYRNIITDWTDAAGEKVDDKNDSDNFNSLQTALDEAAYRAEYDRDRNQQRSNLEEGEVLSIDWYDFVVVETIDFPVDEKVELSMLPPPPPTHSMTSASLPAARAAHEMDESDDEEGETIRVVPSYTPRVVGTANPQAAMAIDPITGKSVPVSDVPEHLRIQLLDPKWAEERKKFQDKQKESNLVGGDAIVNNLSRYSQAKGDLFGKSEQQLLDKERDSKRRLEEANRIIREQATQPPPGFPLPPPAMPPPSQTVEPTAKRVRLEGHVGSNIPAGLPPQPTTTLAPPPPPPPPATDSPKVSGIPMADAMLNAGSNESAEAEETKLLSESDFIASLPRPEVTLQIRVPNDPTQIAWNFHGQILSLTVNALSTIKQVKTDLSQRHLNGMPINKVQLKDPGAGFYNNNDATLAYLNIGPTATLELLAKTRGGRR